MKLEYCIVKDFTIVKLAEKVQGLISEGWLPLGGASYTGATEWFMQTMTRKVAA